MLRTDSIIRVPHWRSSTSLKSAALSLKRSFRRNSNQPNKDFDWICAGTLSPSPSIEGERILNKNLSPIAQDDDEEDGLLIVPPPRSTPPEYCGRFPSAIFDMEDSVIEGQGGTKRIRRKNHLYIRKPESCPQDWKTEDNSNLPQRPNSGEDITVYLNRSEIDNSRNAPTSACGSTRASYNQPLPCYRSQSGSPITPDFIPYSTSPSLPSSSFSDFAGACLSPPFSDVETPLSAPGSSLTTSPRSYTWI